MSYTHEYTAEYLEQERQLDSGFYRVDSDGQTLVYGRFFVVHADYELWRHLKDTYTYPIDGWSWYESEAAARQILNCPKPKTDEEIREEKLQEIARLQQELGLL